MAPAELPGVPRGAFAPYVLPFALWIALLAAQPFLPGGPLYAYPARVVLVGAALLFFRRAYDELAFSASPWGAVVGVLAIAIWIAIDPFVPGLSRLQGGPAPPPFDPGSIADAAARRAFLAFRVAGAVFVVPVMEELFWRGFLARWLVKEDFKSVPVGAFTPFAFGVTAVLFGVEHEQWLAGVACGLLYNGLLWKTRHLPDCVLAHAVSNALLAFWVLSQKAWHLW